MVTSDLRLVPIGQFGRVCRELYLEKMQAVDCGAVKVYDLGIGKTLPSWLSNKQKESLRKDFEFRKRIELIQDFGFKATSRRVKMVRGLFYGMMSKFI